MSLGKENELPLMSGVFFLLPFNAFSLKQEGASEVLKPTEIKQLLQGEAAWRIRLLISHVMPAVF